MSFGLPGPDQHNSPVTEYMNDTCAISAFSAWVHTRSLLSFPKVGSVCCRVSGYTTDLDDHDLLFSKRFSAQKFPEYAANLMIFHQWNLEGDTKGTYV